MKIDIEKLRKQAGISKYTTGFTCWELQLEKFAELVANAALAQQELPQKERPDFMAGYDAGMADAKRMAQQGDADNKCPSCGHEQRSIEYTCNNCGRGVEIEYTAAPAPQPAQANKAEFETLLGEYWDIAHTEGETGLSQSNEANEVLCKLRALLISAQPAQESSMSWGGFNLYGNSESIAKAKQMMHDADTVPELKQRIAGLQSAQPVAQYDKAEMNAFVQDLYDQKMQEGKHGHYETMFHVVHKSIARLYAQPVAPLTVDDFEEWHKANFVQSLARHGYTYSDASVRNRWIGWQAAHGIREVK